MNRSYPLVATVLLAGLVSGCVQPNYTYSGPYGAAAYGSSSYAGYETRQLQTVQYGVVDTVRQVAIGAQNSGVGALTGAALGGVAGSAVGQGRGAVAAAIGGALIGGLAGNAIESSSGQRYGLEITVRLDSGRVVAVTQGADEPFYRGDRVRLLTAPDGSARISH
ncbi:glycine zipper 2TM domain-containing protein [Plasticicumulans acidivorans]|uniref:Outer membrane lipoprotein SlyB n=1 Tax=Plasticicumulans acidivorans TaxID=886464 RepID=A0A317MR54_9GAMM|nr:glycine zipper 2TM domain-containing protein [Plasticicumulans acidivorans]PWV59082.1 outer membrane lipoprotein SlyB [Plasticicumulans acidivorans]